MLRVRLVVVVAGLTCGACLCGSPWYDPYYLCEDLASLSDCETNECVVAVCVESNQCGAGGLAYARIEPRVLGEAQEECEHRRATWYEFWASDCPADWGSDAPPAEVADSGSIPDSVEESDPFLLPRDVQVYCEEWSE